MTKEGPAERGRGDERAAYCSVCGDSLPDEEFALDYPNFVCDECNSAAVNETGETPWHGWPPGEKPETERGVIQMTPDQGENPVFINGIKCWRRYRFGGHIAFRDPFDCRTLQEFYDRHKKEEGFVQIYNSPDPPDECTDLDRILVQKVDQDNWETYVWGMLAADTGEVLARNTVAEQALGPFEDFLNRVEGHAGKEYYEQVITDPTWLLSAFYSFGAQANKPKVQYLVPELDQPITGLSGIVETGALRGLRQHDVSHDVFELGFRPASRCAALSEDSEAESPGQMTLTDVDSPESSDSSNDSTLTVRYELPYERNPKGLLDTGVKISQSILAEIDRAVEQTDYTYLSSRPAVDIHAYTAQREVLTIGLDASTVRDTNWESLSNQPIKLQKHAVTFHESLIEDGPRFD